MGKRRRRRLVVGTGGGVAGRGERGAAKSSGVERNGAVGHRAGVEKGLVLRPPGEEELRWADETEEEESLEGEREEREETEDYREGTMFTSLLMLARCSIRPKLK
jgi:hypothetical protein